MAFASPTPVLKWCRENEEKLSAKGTPELKVNVFELVAVLKVLGFRLDSVDYDHLNIPGKQTDLTLEIKCGFANIVAKMTSPAETCSCPMKGENQHNNSFWEIQGTDPFSIDNKITDTSSNLLPELTAKGLRMSKHLLSVIFEIVKKETVNNKNDNNNNNDDRVVNLNKKCLSPATSPLRRISLDKRLLNDDLRDYLEPMIPSESGNTLQLTPKVVVTSSPNEEQSPFEITSSTSSQVDLARDINVINQITEARKKLDSALVMLKLNITHDLAESSILTVTPQKLDNLSAIGPKTKSFPEIKRRQSLPFSNIKSKIDSNAPGKAKPVMSATKASNTLKKSPINLARKVATNNLKKNVSTITPSAKKATSKAYSIPRVATLGKK